MPGATVEVASPALMGGTKSAITSATGTYVFLNLPIGRYTVTAVALRLQDDRAREHRGVGRRDGHARFRPAGRRTQRDRHGHRRRPARRRQDVDDRLADRQGAAREAADEPGCLLRPRADGAGHVRLGSELELAAEPDGVRQRDQRERVPHQRRQRHQSGGRMRSARSSTSTTTPSRKSASSVSARRPSTAASRARPSTW